MVDFHIPNDPEWQWAYDLILYGVGEQFPEADPSALRAIGDDLYAFSKTVTGGMAATAGLGGSLSGSLTGPAADAFAKFQLNITDQVPNSANISTGLGASSYQSALDSESTQYGIAVDVPGPGEVESGSAGGDGEGATACGSCRLRVGRGRRGWLRPERAQGRAGRRPQPGRW